MKVVINKCYGGYDLSPEACLWLYERGFRGEYFATPVNKYYTFKGVLDANALEDDLHKWETYCASKRKMRSSFITVFSPDKSFVLNGRYTQRSHPLVIECVETLKEKANGACAELHIVEIPDEVEWEIEEYDGMESIHEEHGSWS